MRYQPSKQLPREKGVPYSIREILLERVNFEDRLRAAARPAPVIPPSVQEFPDKLQLTPVAAFVLGRQMVKRSIKIMTTI